MKSSRASVCGFDSSFSSSQTAFMISSSALQELWIVCGLTDRTPGGLKSIVFGNSTPAASAMSCYSIPLSSRGTFGSSR